MPSPTFSAAKKYVVSSSLEQLDWHAELVSRLELDSGAVATRYEPKKVAVGLASKALWAQWPRNASSSHHDGASRMTLASIRSGA